MKRVILLAMQDVEMRGLHKVNELYGNVRA